MASTPLVPIFKLVPSRGLPYVPVRPLNSEGLRKTPAAHVQTPTKVALRRGYSNHISS